MCRTNDDSIALRRRVCTVAEVLIFGRLFCFFIVFSRKIWRGGVVVINVIVACNAIDIAPIIFTAKVVFLFLETAAAKKKRRHVDRSPFGEQQRPVNDVSE